MNDSIVKERSWEGYLVKFDQLCAEGCILISLKYKMSTRKKSLKHLFSKFARRYWRLKVLCIGWKLYFIEFSQKVFSGRDWGPYTCSSYSVWTSKLRTFSDGHPLKSKSVCFMQTWRQVDCRLKWHHRKFFSDWRL